MTIIPYFIAVVALVAGILGLSRFPYAVFLFRRILEFTWPTAEATLSKAGVLSIVIAEGEGNSTVVWDSVFQVSYLANGQKVFGYFAFRSYEIEPAEAQGLQSSWHTATLPLRYDPRHPETFAFSRKFAGTYDVIYLPEFSGPSLGSSADLVELPKSADVSESQ
jgi:hypothetical protein